MEKQSMRKISCLNRVAVLFLFFFVLGCGNAKERIYKRTFISAGTFVEVTSPYKTASGIAEKEFSRLEKVFNIYDKKSEISKVNLKAGVKPVKVSKDLIDLLELSKQLYTFTDGAFDPSIGRVILFWKKLMKDKTITSLPKKEEIDRLMKFRGMDNIVIDKDASTVFIKKKGIILDLGGIAKGYMVDKAVQALKKSKIDSALINAGGDLFCLGRFEGRDWKIGIRSPESLSVILKVIDADNSAVATSGDYEQFFKYKGSVYSHIINPKTGYPISNPARSVTVSAPNATTADGMATAFFVLGKDKIPGFLYRKHSNLKVFVF